MLDQEFEEIIGDQSKQIVVDIDWVEDEDHSPTLEFRADVISDEKYPLFIKGSYNPLINALTYALIHRNYGRIYALDMGKDHHNPSCNNVGEKHMHRWQQSMRDKDAYNPSEITANASDPVAVWKQFCTQAKITHSGKMSSPPPIQWKLEI